MKQETMDRVTDFISGIPITLAIPRLMLLIVELLETIEEQGREVDVIVAEFIRRHESRDDSNG